MVIAIVNVPVRFVIEKPQFMFFLSKKVKKVPLYYIFIYNRSLIINQITFKNLKHDLLIKINVIDVLTKTFRKIRNHTNLSNLDLTLDSFLIAYMDSQFCPDSKRRLLN